MCADHIQTRSGICKNFIKLALRLSTCIIAVNREICDALIKLSGVTNKIKIIEAFSLTESIDKAMIENDIYDFITKHRPLLSCTGFSSPEYGLHLIPALVSKLLDKYPNIGIVVIGACSPNEGEIARNNKAIKWVGRQDRLTSLYLMGHSDLFVRPSLKDGDALSVREAMALDIPIVASNVGYRPKGIITFEAGSLKGFTSAVEKALHLPKMARQPQSRKHDYNLYKIINCYEKHSG